MPTTTDKAAPPPDQPTKPATTARRRRWPWIVLAVAVVLAILIFISPYVASTGPVQRLVVGAINDNIDGKIAPLDYSLNWTGPTRINRVVLLDRQGRQVLVLDNASLSGGIVQLASNYEHFGRLEIDSAQVTLLQDKQGHISLLDALASTRPKKEKARKPPSEEKLPAPVGQIVLNKAAVRVIAADGQQYDITDVNSQVTLDTLNNIAAAISADLPGGGRIQGNADASGMVVNGALSPTAGQAKFQLASAQPVDLAQLRPLMPPDQALSGRASFSFSGQVANGALQVNWQVSGQDLQSLTTQGTVAPLDLSANGNVQLANGELHSQSDISSSAGKLTATLTAQTQQPVQPLTGQQLMAAIFKGAELSLPAFSLQASGQVDLSKLAQAVPSVLDLTPQARIQSGQVVIDRINVLGGSRPKADIQARVVDLVAQTADQTIRYQPMELSLAGEIQPDVGLSISKGQLSSGFATAQISGNASDLKGSYQVDLRTLQQQLAPVFNINLPVLAQADGSVTLARAADDRINFAVQSRLNSLDYRRGPNRLTAKSAAIEASGNVLLAGTQIKAVTLDSAQASIDDRVAAAMSGNYDFDQKSFNGQATLQRTDIATVRAYADSLGMQLPPYVGVVSAKVQAEGQAGGQIKLAISDGSVQGLGYMSTRPEAATQTAPRTYDMTFAGDATLASQESSGALRLGGPATQLDAKFRYAGGQTSLGSGGLMSALTGGPVQLPQFDLAAKGWIDAGLLGALVPSLAESPDLNIAAGRINIANLAANGGSSPQVNVQMQATDLRIIRQGQTIQPGPANLALAAKIEPSVGLRIDQGQFDWASTRVNLSGTAEKLALELNSDLGAANNSLLQIVGPSSPNQRVEGQLHATATLSDLAKNQPRFDLQVQGQDLVLIQADQRHDIGPLDAAASGQITLDQQRKATRVELASASVSSGQDIQTAAKGSYNMQTGEMAADLNVGQASIPKVLALAQVAGAKVSGADRLSGSLSITSHAQRANTNAPLQFACKGQFRDLTVDGKAVSPGGAVLEADGVELSPAQHHLVAQTIKLTSDPANVSAQGINVALDQSGAMSGKLDISADLARTMTIARAIAGANWPDVAGQLAYSGQVQNQSGQTSFNGQGTIDNFSVAAGQAQVSEPRITLAQNVGYDSGSDVLTLQDFSINSQMLTLKASGKATQLKGPAVLDISGQYQASWDRIVQLLHAISPDTAGNVQIAGTTSGPIVLKGPAHVVGDTPPFKQLTGSTTIQWDSATLYGLALGKAQLKPELANGVVNVPDTLVPASTGQVLLAASMDFRPTPAAFSLTGKKVLLSNVPLGPELSKELLGRVNPLLTYKSTLEGMVSLNTQDVYFPLSATAIKDARGQGRMDLSNLTIVPGGPMLALVQLLNVGQTNNLPIKVDGVDFRLANGKLQYDHLRMSLPNNITLDFAGTVDLVNDQVDMSVMVPLTPELLSKLGVRSSQYSSLLSGVSVAIPIHGSRGAPTLDFGKVDTSKIFTSGGKQAAGQAVEQTLQNFLGKPGTSGGGAAQPAPQQAPAPQGQQAPSRRHSQQAQSQPTSPAEQLLNKVLEKPRRRQSNGLGQDLPAQRSPAQPQQRQPSNQDNQTIQPAGQPPGPPEGA